MSTQGRGHCMCVCAKISRDLMGSDLVLFVAVLQRFVSTDLYLWLRRAQPMQVECSVVSIE